MRQHFSELKPKTKNLPNILSALVAIVLGFLIAEIITYLVALYE